MSKQIPVLNSPWDRSTERPSDCARWIKQGDAALIDGTLVFNSAYVARVKKQSLQNDPVGYDDGTLRRWVNRSAYRKDGRGGYVDIPAEAALNGNLIDGKLIVKSWSGHPCKQLRPISQVGTGAFVTKNPDKLRRRTKRFRTIEPGKSEQN